ncbi:hypothetical protein M011DRAFT_477612 [Sporormia fimetaria CBS 119925]|uniref:Oxidase ustYa n=1 Tax=Sporormia fimetaria CBS 119925 TaxID=1340428 RepID=A0A6A6VB98_9PLEO|nr:hypothetical protein M011DRAFT_477612 [Sporormia fimetaria CBS 119925]
MKGITPRWIQSGVEKENDTEVEYHEIEPLHAAAENYEDSVRPESLRKVVKILAGANVGLLVTVGILLWATLKEGTLSSKSHNGPWWSKDIIDKGPEIAVTFKPAYNYSSFDFKSIKNLYTKYPLDESKLLAVPVPNAQKYGIPPGYPTLSDSQIENYSPAFIHQFHCLSLWRDSYWMLRHRLGIVPANYIPPVFIYWENEREHLNHVEHCMDYLRQTISCWADTTMEGPEPHKDGRRIHTDGMGMRHQCWDMEAVWERFREMRVPMRYLNASRSAA